ncbi:MAG: ABC transporter ATP-binding protein [Proteobacteria bacterium]|nr:ABC transporter ATP-binding protein [Pseudomonadota bacterium]
MRSTRMTPEPLLALRGLSVTLGRGAGETRALEDVSLTLAAAARLGLVGESGAGKSQLALAIAGLGGPAARVSGSIRFEGAELVGAPEPRLRRVRGARIGMVFQDPGSALAPHLTIGTQLAEVLVAHGRARGAAARAAALAMLERVRVPDPAARLGQYPHELSGGLRQRVLIAMALIAGPSLLVADEPTTALDATVEAGILELFREAGSAGTALLLVSHDLAVVAGVCEEIAVLYAGRLVERGPVRAVLATPRHPYTAGLAAARLALDTPLEAPLVAIPGQPPGRGARPAGCAYAARCPRSLPRCAHEVPPLEAAGARAVACFAPLGAGERP